MLDILEWYEWLWQLNESKFQIVLVIICSFCAGWLCGDICSCLSGVSVLNGYFVAPADSCLLGLCWVAVLWHLSAMTVIDGDCIISCFWWYHSLHYTDSILYIMFLGMASSIIWPRMTSWDFCVESQVISDANSANSSCLLFDSSQLSEGSRLDCLVMLWFDSSPWLHEQAPGCHMWHGCRMILS